MVRLAHIRRLQRAVALAALALLLSGCEARRTAATDAGAPSTDARPSDALPFDGRVCGGARPLLPTPLPSERRPCGTACTEILRGRISANRVELEGDLVVFELQPDPQRATTIGYLRLSTGVAVQILPQVSWVLQFDGYNRCEEPASDGQRIAYRCIRTCTSAPDCRVLAVFDVTTGIETDLVCGLPLVGSPVIGARGVVMDSARSVLHQPFAASAWESPQKLVEDPRQSWLHAAGELVVWSLRNPPRGVDLVVYDLATGTTKTVASSTSMIWWPRTDGRRVIWADSRHDPDYFMEGSGDNAAFGDTEVYSYDTQRGVTERVTSNRAQQIHPDISGAWAVWQDARNDPEDITPLYYAWRRTEIFAKQLETGREYCLTCALPDAALPRHPRVDAGRALYVVSLEGAPPGEVAYHLVDLEAFAKAQQK